MNEHDSRLELGPDQNTLKDAWKALAEALVLRGKTIDPMGAELPASADGQQPFTFSHKLDKSFVYAELVDDKQQAVIAAAAEYSMPHKIEAGDDAAIDYAAIEWTTRIQGTDIFINHTISTRRIVTESDERYEGHVYEEYFEVLPDGKERRISRAGYEYPMKDRSDDDMRRMLEDEWDNEHPIGFGDTENMHKVAKLIRPL